MAISVRLYHDKEGKTSFCGSDSVGYFDGRKTLRTCIIEQKERQKKSKKIWGDFNNGYARFFTGDIMSHNWISGYVYVGTISQNEYDKFVNEKMEKWNKL